MIKQKCIRTYEKHYGTYPDNPCAEVNCKTLNSYLKAGWKVVMVTPKSNYNEYIIEKEIKEGEDDAEGVHVCSRKENYKNEKIKEKLKEKYLDESIKEWENIPLIQRASMSEFSFYDGYLACAAKFENQKLN